MEIIGRHKYNYLKSLNDEQLSEEGKELIRTFENKSSFTAPLTAEQIERNKDYAKRVRENEFFTKESYSLPYLKFLEFFKLFYKEYNGFEFIENDTTLINIKTLLYYFSLDKRFLSSPILQTKITVKGKVRECLPSSKKGLMIIGEKGVSKSTSFIAIYSIYQKSLKLGRKLNLSFAYFTAEEVVMMFKSCANAIEEKEFWDKMTRGDICFDDVKSEGIVNKYGKENLFQRIFQLRDDKKLRTHVIINFKDGHRHDVGEAIHEMGELYGGRVYDRIFSNYNIIAFKGESLRK